MVKTKHGNFEVRSITFGERRQMHMLAMKAYKNDQLDIDGYFALSDWIMKKAFDDYESQLKDFNDTEVDEIINDIYTYYKGLSKKKNSK